MRIPFARQSAFLERLPGSAQRLVNLYAEQSPPDGRSDVIIQATPGLTPKYDVGTGPVHAMETIPGKMYVVSGTHFYRFVPDTDYGPEDLGDIGTPSNGIYTIAVGIESAVVVAEPNAYVCGNTTGDPLSQITGDTFPGASSVAYLDGYFVFTATGSGAEFFTSELLSPTTFDALNFAYADFRPNAIRIVKELRGDLWFMGEAGAEVWYDAGTVNFPFARRPGTDIARGLLSPFTVVECDSSIFWLGSDLIVYRSRGYSAERVSDVALEEWMRDLVILLGLDACSYSQNGHEFYCLTFTGPTLQSQRSVAYDCATKLWADRASGADGTGVWRARSALMRGGAPLAGDRYTGALHLLEPGGLNDVGVPRVFVACLPPLWAETRRAFMSRLELEMDVGDKGALVTLEKSDDGGYTFTDPRAASTGAVGNYRARVVWNRLGSFFQRVLRFTFTSPPTLYGADVNMDGGKW